MTALAGAVHAWTPAVEAAERHGVLPLMHRWIESAHPALLPASIVETVRRRAQGHAMQSLVLAGEMLALSRRLEAAGIPVIALKGPPLAVRAYGGMALRPQVDVDLLVHAGDVDRALAALAEAGYRRVYELAAGQDAAFRDVEYHHALTGPTGVPVELHWGIIKRQFGLSVAEALWWSHTQRIALGGGEVVALSDEVTLVYLAIHGAKHEWPYLRWIGDMSAVARLEGMDWAAVRAMSVQLGALRMLRLALALATGILGSAMPEAAMRLAREDPAVAPLVAEIRARIDGGGKAPGFVGSTRFQFGVRERVRDKAAFAVRHAVTPNIEDLRTAELPAAWSGLYHVLRPVRLGRKWVGMVLGGRPKD